MTIVIHGCQGQNLAPSFACWGIYYHSFVLPVELAMTWWGSKK